MRSRFDSRSFALVAALALPSCGGPKSALNGAGLEESEIGRLFWVMLGAGAVIWLVVMGIAKWAVLRPPCRRRGARPDGLTVWGGVAVPVVSLGALLVYGLGVLDFRTQAAARLRIHVEGRQWWWRVRY